MARETRETHHEWDVDVLGAFPQPEPTDSEIAIIDDLLEKYGDTLRTFVLLKRAARATPAVHPGNDSNKCWPKYKCSTRDYLMLRVRWRTGVRVNELLTITPGDIEPNNNVINVTKAKGGKQRRVHLDAETIKMLSEYVSAQKLPDDRPIFELKQRQVRNIVKRYGDIIGRDVHPHTFRHSYAIHCVRNG